MLHFRRKHMKNCKKLTASAIKLFIYKNVIMIQYCALVFYTSEVRKSHEKYTI